MHEPEIPSFPPQVLGRRRYKTPSSTWVLTWERRMETRSLSLVYTHRVARVAMSLSQSLRWSTQWTTALGLSTPMNWDCQRLAELASNFTKIMLQNNVNNSHFSPFMACDDIMMQNFKQKCDVFFVKYFVSNSQ